MTYGYALNPGRNARVGTYIPAVAKQKRRRGNHDLDTPQLIQELSRPEAYARGRTVDAVRFQQTHISLLFFVGDRVYKVKKPVDLGFLDFSSLDRRRHFCEEEVRLNRRLAAHIYHGVVAITSTPDGHLEMGGSGEALEWAVEMSLLPEHRMLSGLLDEGQIDNQQMNDLVALLAEFHHACPTGPGVDEHGSPAAVSAHVDQNLEQLTRFLSPPDGEVSAQTGLRVMSATQHAFLSERRREYLEANAELLEERVRRGRIREGHGDLHSDNICLPEGGIVIYDCIEFSRELRCGDVAADLGFLAMDLDQRGYPGFSEYLVKRYARSTQDLQLRSLMRFYKGYRAVVRGKVAALTATAADLTPQRREALRAESMRYLQLALGYELPPMLVLMCGLPACGKSYIAKHLSRPLRAPAFHSDVRRKVLVGVAPTQRQREEQDEGIYAPERRRGTYRSLLESAVQALQAGRSAIVDATFARREYRAPFVEAAKHLGVPYLLLHVVAPDDVTRARLERREHEIHEGSDAGLDVYLRARSSFEPPTELPDANVLCISSPGGTPEDQCALVIDRMIALAR